MLSVKFVVLHETIFYGDDDTRYLYNIVSEIMSVFSPWLLSHVLHSLALDCHRSLRTHCDLFSRDRDSFFR